MFGFVNFSLKMINVNADCIVSIYENARLKVDSLFELLDENLTWREEIQEEARKAFQRYRKIQIKYRFDFCIPSLFF